MAAEGKGGLWLFRSPIQFDLFELEANRGELRRSGQPVDMSPQALTLLVLLTERPRELVTRKELKEALWPGQSYGDFDSRLNFVIKKLREALGDDAEQPRYIQTVRNAGYRFIAPVREPVRTSALTSSAGNLAARKGGAPEPRQPTLMAPQGLQPAASRLFPVLAALVIVALTAALVFVLRLPSSSQAVVSGAQGHGASGGGAAAESAPEIFHVTPILPQPRQSIVIKGRGFGLHVPYAHTDSPYLAIRDETADWAAGRMIPQNWDEVMLDVDSWTDTEIILSGFSGRYGMKSWHLSPGDDLTITIWNPQSGARSVGYHATVVSEKVMH